MWNEKKHWIPHNSFPNATIDLKYNSQTNKTIQHNIKQTKQINNQPLAADVSTWLNVATRAMVPEAVREPDAAMSNEVSQPVHTTYNPRGRLNQTAEFYYHHGPEPTVVTDGIELLIIH